MRKGYRTRQRTPQKQMQPKTDKRCPMCKGPLDSEWAIAKGRGVQWICTKCYGPYAQRK